MIPLKALYLVQINDTYLKVSARSRYSLVSDPYESRSEEESQVAEFEQLGRNCAINLSYFCHPKVDLLHKEDLFTNAFRGICMAVIQSLINLVAHITLTTFYL